jgi:hypothetical protein
MSMQLRAMEEQGRKQQRAMVVVIAVVMVMGVERVARVRVVPRAAVVLTMLQRWRRCSEGSSWRCWVMRRGTS